jgi:hypothetical protein
MMQQKIDMIKQQPPPPLYSRRQIYSSSYFQSDTAVDRYEENYQHDHEPHTAVDRYDTAAATASLIQ